MWYDSYKPDLGANFANSAFRDMAIASLPTWALLNETLSPVQHCSTRCSVSS
jgi:hypothetical protein